MDDIIRWHREKMAERTVEALIKNGFQSRYIERSEDVLKYLLDSIPENARVGWGGSKTVEQTGLLEALRQRGQEVIEAFGAQLSPEESMENRRQSLLSDIFLAGTNAVTEDGKLVNVDGTGNRVAAMLFGPPRVIVLTGINKIVPDVAAGMDRIRRIAAPMNGRRLARKTPCAIDGVCRDCHSPERMCNGYVIHERKMKGAELEIIIIGEDMGY